MKYIVDNFPHLPEKFRSRVTSVSFSKGAVVGSGRFNGLNLCFNTGDRFEDVLANRRHVMRKVAAHAIVAGNQVHGNRIVMLENRHIGKGDAYLFGAEPDIPDTDGLITDIPGVALLVKQADCQAITMFDPVHGVIANIHCGWRGNVKGIISNAVEYMCKNRGSAASDIWASISPAIGVCCMEFDGWRTLLPQHMHRFVANDHCDFRAVSRSQLEACGIPPAHVHCSETCTCCSDDFFSYRREKVTGRCGTVIVMHDNTTGERQGKRYG